MRVGIVALMAVMVVLSARPSAADDLTTQLAQGGDWFAMAHRPSMVSRTDLCLAFNMKSGVAFRYDGENMQMRMVDKSWTLPADVSGALVVSIGDLSETYIITDNDATSVNVELDEEEYSKFFAKMDKASSMNVVVGKAKPVAVSLSGSTRVMNAFKTCGSIKSDVDGGGVNPFK